MKVLKFEGWNIPLDSISHWTTAGEGDLQRLTIFLKLGDAKVNFAGAARVKAVSDAPALSVEVVPVPLPAASVRRPSRPRAKARYLE